MRKILLPALLALILSSCVEVPGIEESDSSDVLWKSDLGAFINPALGRNYMPAVDENDNIYVLMTDWESDNLNAYVLQAFNKNGEELWKKEEQSETLWKQMPGYYDGNIFYSTMNKIVCLDAADGSEKWVYTPGDTLQTSHSLVIADGKLVVGLPAYTADHSYLFALNISDGSVVATHPVFETRKLFALAANGSTLYAAYNQICSIELGSSGFTENWRTLLPGNNSEYEDTYNNSIDDIVIDPTSGKIYTSISNPYEYNDEKLVAFNISGELLWESTDYACSHPTTNYGDELYIPSGDLYKLDGTDGSLVWSAEPPSETFGFGNSFDCLVYANNDVLYCGDYFGLYGVDKSGQEDLKIFPEALSGTTSPLSFTTLLSNGNIIVLAMSPDPETESSRIYCIKASTQGTKANIWAKWGANVGNTFNLLEE